MPVYSGRLGYAVLTVGVLTKLGQVPEGWRWILRDLIVHNGHTAEAGIEIYISSPAGLLPMWLEALAASKTHHRELRQVAYQNDELYARASQPGMTVVICGYQFEEA